MPGSSWIERLVVPVDSGSSPTPPTRGPRRRSRSTAKRSTADAFGSTARKRRNDPRADLEAVAADGRPAKAADDSTEAEAPEAGVVSNPAAVYPPLAQPQHRPEIGVATAVVIVIAAVVVVVIVIAATAEADAKVVDATSVTTGVAAAIADVVGPREERAQAKADADVVAADVEREAAAKVAKDRRTTTSTILTTEPPVGVCGSRRSLCSLGQGGGALTWWPPRGPLDTDRRGGLLSR